MSRLFSLGLGVILFLAGAPLLLSGCASNSTQTAASPLIPSDSVLEANKGDIAGLYRSWIAPFVQDGLIPHEDSRQLSQSEEAIRGGFARFCSMSGGNLQKKREARREQFLCTTSSGDFIGQFTLTRIGGNSLYVPYESPRQRAQRESEQQEFDKRKALNGPAGWVVTDEGRFRFLRIGDLRERHVLVVKFGANSGEYVPIEEVVRIEFHPTCCDIDVTLTDGRKKTLNSAHLVKKVGPNALVSGDSLHLAIIDPATKQPYTRVFSGNRTIRSLEIDQKDATTWSTVPLKVIETTFDARSKERLDQYVKKLKADANRLYSEAAAEGWIKVLPDGKLTPQLLDYLKNELQRASWSDSCGADPVEGIVSLDDVLKCQVASRELKVIGEGYSVITEFTPLSTIILLTKIGKDLR